MQQFSDIYIPWSWCLYSLRGFERREESKAEFLGLWEFQTFLHSV